MNSKKNEQQFLSHESHPDILGGTSTLVEILSSGLGFHGLLSSRQLLIGGSDHQQVRETSLTGQDKTVQTVQTVERGKDLKSPREP